MDFGRENAESSFEDIESEAASLKERGDEIEQRESQLSDAIDKLESDTAITKSLEANERDLESQKEELESERTDTLASLNAISEMLEQLEEANNQSDASLDQLRELGEDVSDAESIIDARRRWLEECYARVEHLYEMLGEDYEKIGNTLSRNGEKTKETSEINAAESNDTPAHEALGLGSDSQDWTTSSTDPVSAYSDYMTAHKLTKKDFPTYSKTLEWRRLVHAAFPNYKRPPLDRETAHKLLTEYMYSHNYSKEDYETYSADPEWQYLTLTAYPETIDIVKNWVRSINPNFENISLPYDQRKLYSSNCGSCAYALEQHFNGSDPEMTATAKNIDSDEEMERITGLTCKYMDPEDIESILIKRGPGSHLIAGINRYPIGGKPLFGHWFNAYYDGKKVYCLDGQSGDVFDWPHDFINVSEWCALV